MTSALRLVIEEARDTTGLPMGKLTVLAEQHDPYRLDTPIWHGRGAWVAQQMELVHRPTIHLRGLHYAIVARGAVPKPDGGLYINDNASWVWLQEKAAKAARWLGYVPFTAIVDERNAAPVIHRRPRMGSPDTFVSSSKIRFELPKIGTLRPMPIALGMIGQQPYSLVIVGEKASLGEVLLPIAQEYGADLYLPTGEISDTLVYQIAADAAADGRPLRLFYLADFDPAGYEMPANVGRKLQALRDLEFPNLDFECRQVALTYEQVRELGLPSTPLKEDEKRSPRWRAAWGGAEQTEIDALATLRPRVLRRIVRAALDPFYDATLVQRVRAAEGDWEEEAQKLIDAQVDMTALRGLRKAAQAKIVRFAKAIDALNVRVQEATEAADIELPPLVVPDAVVDLEAHGKPLVSSAWPWVEQTEALRNHKSYYSGNGDARD